MGFLGEFIEEVEYREKVGYAMLAFIAIYFLTNLIPILINMVIGCKRIV